MRKSWKATILSEQRAMHLHAWVCLLGWLFAQMGWHTCLTSSKDTSYRDWNKLMIRLVRNDPGILDAPSSFLLQ